jgi:hypothetical protein
MGSPDRAVDSFYVPLRGVSHLFTPLYASPFNFPLVGVLVWMSSAVCSFAALAILLRLWSRQPWTHGRAILFGVVVLGLLALGFTGTMNQRYRSILLAALLPMGMRSFREEVAVHGFRRFIFGGIALPVSIFLIYRIVR